MGWLIIATTAGVLVGWQAQYHWLKSKGWRRVKQVNIANMVNTEGVEDSIKESEELIARLRKDYPWMNQTGDKT